MATIQAKTIRGHKYWYIVASRRVNGKPRPVVLAYLGKADNLLKRLQGLTEGLKLKSYSHGAVAALLNTAHTLDIGPLINRYIQSPRSYMADQPIRNNLTAGISLLLGAIGRICMPTSKRGWWTWAQGTSLEYLLRCSLSKIDSQHFWDLMDALPVEAISPIEQELARRTIEAYHVKSDSLFYDTTNFYTYIHTTNAHCSVAQRGKNKQKRYDLRQVGLALVVTKEDMIPLFHQTYQGNLNDVTVFADLMGKIRERMRQLGLDIEKHTVVFDRGNNSKKNLATIEEALGLHYVGALTPYHHQQLICDAEKGFKQVKVGASTLHAYRDKRVIWSKERTVVVYISEQLKAGQIRGLYQSLQKKEKALQELQQSLGSARGKKRDKQRLQERIGNLLKDRYIRDIVQWSLTEVIQGTFALRYSINHESLREIEDAFGFRIVMTDRHEWTTEQIVTAYHGQSTIEQAFKNVKNPYHLALRPQFHWTDQKIIVHFFICVLGYLLAMLVWREVKRTTGFKVTLDSLLDTLNRIRLCTILEEKKTSGKMKATYKLEEMTKEEEKIVAALRIKDLHINRPILNGVGVYTAEKL